MQSPWHRPQGLEEEQPLQPLLARLWRTRPLVLPWVGVMQKSYARLLFLAFIWQPGTGRLSLRWKHLRPFMQSESRSQSPWHWAHLWVVLQPETPLLTRLWRFRPLVGPWVGVMQKSADLTLPLPTMRQPGTGCRALRWKHWRPGMHWPSLSQSPWQTPHFLVEEQPLQPLLTRLWRTRPLVAPWVGVMQKSYALMLLCAFMRQPGTGRLSLRWKHWRPVMHCLSLSQSPSQRPHFLVEEQPLPPRFTRL